MAEEGVVCRVARGAGEEHVSEAGVTFSADAAKRIVAIVKALEQAQRDLTARRIVGAANGREGDEEVYFPAKINTASPVSLGGNRWAYTWVEQQLKADGSGWENRPDGRTGTAALNALEAFGNGPSAAVTGTPVVTMLVDFVASADQVPALVYWFAAGGGGGSLKVGYYSCGSTPAQYFDFTPIGWLRFGGPAQVASTGGHDLRYVHPEVTTSSNADGTTFITYLHCWTLGVGHLGMYGYSEDATPVSALASDNTSTADGAVTVTFAKLTQTVGGVTSDVLHAGGLGGTGNGYVVKVSAEIANLEAVRSYPATLCDGTQVVERTKKIDVQGLLQAAVDGGDANRANVSLRAPTARGMVLQAINNTTWAAQELVTVE